MANIAPIPPVPSIPEASLRAAKAACMKAASPAKLGDGPVSSDWTKVRVIDDMIREGKRLDR